MLLHPPLEGRVKEHRRCAPGWGDAASPRLASLRLAASTLQGEVKKESSPRTLSFITYAA